jgi:hypothetical protein
MHHLNQGHYHGQISQKQMERKKQLCYLIEFSEQLDT